MVSQKRAFTVGIDALVLPIVEKLAREGRLPNFQRLMAHGSRSKLLPCVPVWTPTNWATLATGALPGTHGAGLWRVRQRDGTLLNAFESNAIAAESIWEVAERAGHKCVLIRYPATAPSRLRSGVVIDGFGEPHYGSTPFEVTPAMLYTLDAGIQRATAVTLRQGRGWAGLPDSRQPLLEADLLVRPKHQGEDVLLHLAILDSKGSGYDRVIVKDNKGAARALADLSVGEWSPWSSRSYSVEEGALAGSMRFKLLELAPDASALRLYRSQVVATDLYTDPPQWGPRLSSLFGPYVEHTSFALYKFGWIDLDTVFEETEYRTRWWANVVRYLFENEGFTMFSCHWHMVDHLFHHYLSLVDPESPSYEPEHLAENFDVIVRTHALADYLLGEIMDLAGEQDYVLVVSDHGCSYCGRTADVPKLLEQHGLLARERTPDGQWRMVWEQTKAYRDGLYIRVNLRGREPHGIVEAEDFEEVQWNVINALYGWRDPVNNRCPISFALRKQDQAILGYWGDQAGDVLFVFNPGYSWGDVPDEGTFGDVDASWMGARHGPQIPTAGTQLASNMGTLIAAGPGIKEGYVFPEDIVGPAMMQDVVPTLAHLLGFAPPAQSQGKVLYHMLEGHEPAYGLGDERLRWDASNRVWVQKDMFDGSALKKQAP